MTVEEYYTDGYSIRQIAQITRFSRKRISRMLKEKGISIRQTDITSRRYTCNESYFHTIDTEEKAYWLGFIAADGFIEAKRKNGNQKFGVTLSDRDKSHLEKLNKALDSTYPIKEYAGSGYNKNGKFVRLLITSQTLVDDLKRHGIVEQKTNILKFPTHIPQKLYKHFIRGYLDGDGSISCFEKTDGYWAYQVSFIGTYDMLSAIQTVLGIKNKVSFVRNDIYELKANGTNKPLFVLTQLYDNATIYLERKHRRYNDLKEYVERRGKNGRR